MDVILYAIQGRDEEMYIIGVVIPVIFIFGAIVWGLLEDKRLLIKIITIIIATIVMSGIIIWQVERR